MKEFFFYYKKWKNSIHVYEHRILAANQEAANAKWQEYKQLKNITMEVKREKKQKKTKLQSTGS